jgi:signal transduction histidine kinase/ActR/RegA family two-component response regulator/HPt (histidine-containing phosphotransfer) domain-containing protein
MRATEIPRGACTLNNAKELIKTNYRQILLVFVVFLMMGLISYFYASRIVRQQVEIIGDTSLETIMSQVSVNLQNTGAILAYVAQNLEEMLPAASNAELLEFIRKTHGQFTSSRSPLPNFMKIYAQMRGEFLDGSGWVPPRGYVPEASPWYVGADRANGRVFFSSPYVDAETGNFCISFSRKILDSQGNAYGILSMDMMLGQITSYVQHQRIAGRGYGILLDDQLNFIVHYDQSLIWKNVREAGGDFPELTRILVNQGKISALGFRDTDGSDSVIFFRKIFNGWYLGALIPYADFYHEVYRLAAMLGALGLILTAVLSYLLVYYRLEKIRSDEKNLGKSAFLARVSHEIRTPMNAIIGLSELIKRDYGKPQVVGYIDEIRKAGMSLLTLINDILDLSRAESGHQIISDGPYRSVALFSELLSMVHAYIGEKHLQLTVEISPNIPLGLIGDQVRVRQILLNLLSNAIKYTPQGEVRFSADCRSRISDTVTLEFRVMDSGIGIREEDLPHLFGEFVRVDETANSHIVGTGLGLSIAKNLSRGMGGDIVVESVYGKGSTFIATIVQRVDDWMPIGAMADWHEQPEKEAGEQTLFIAPDCRALVVDDVAFNLVVAKGLLSLYRLDIVTCQSGKEAIELVRQQYFDLIFMDHMMPEMDGIEATKRLRKMGDWLADAPIIALTANAIVGMKELFLKNGFDDFLSKPIEINKLHKIMEKWVPTEKRRPVEATESGSEEQHAPSIEGIDVARGVATIGGSLPAYIDALKIYCLDVEKQLPILLEFSGNEMRSFITSVHGLKSASANVGAMELSEVAAILEQAGRDSDIELIRARLDEFIDNLTQLLTRIKDVLKAQMSLREGEAQIDAGVLEQLAAALEAMNISEIDRLVDEISARPLDKRSREALDDISSQILMAEFDEAGETVKKLLRGEDAGK